MYDALTTRYTFACPTRGEASVRLSAFREVDRLPGAAHPAVFRVRFACGCGEEHIGLVPHDDLDWAPLGLDDGATFLNLMTARLEPLDSEFADLAIRRIQAGQWPWSFFCYPEERPRPVFPSFFRLLAPSAPDGSIGLAVLCPACFRISINLVTHEHVDLPFHNDAEIGVIEHVFASDTTQTLDEFRAHLYSSGLRRTPATARIAVRFPSAWYAPVSSGSAPARGRQGSAPAPVSSGSAPAPVSSDLAPVLGKVKAPAQVSGGSAPAPVSSGWASDQGRPALVWALALVPAVAPAAPAVETRCASSASSTIKQG